MFGSQNLFVWWSNEKNNKSKANYSLKNRGDHLSRAHFNGFVKDGQNWRRTLLFILFDILVLVCHWGESIFERLEFVFHVCSERNTNWTKWIMGTCKNNTWRWNDVNRSELKYKMKKKKIKKNWWFQDWLPSFVVV